MMGRQWALRSDSARSALEALGHQPAPVRSVVYFAGKPVQGSAAIDARFVADFLRPYLEAVKTQYAAHRFGRVGERGPRREEEDARLMIASTPRGSFGFEFVAPPSSNLFAGDELAQALRDIALTLDAVADSDDAYLARLDDIPERVLGRMKEMFDVLSQGGAGIEMHAGDLVVSIKPERARQGCTRLQQSLEKVEEVERRGVFRGATLESWRFDLRTDDDEVLKGRIDAALDEDQVADMIRRTNEPCVARLSEITVTTPSGAVRRRFVLLGLE